MTAEERQQQEDATRRAEELSLVLLLLASGTRNDGRTVTFVNGRYYIDGKVVSVDTIRGYLQRIELRTARQVADLAAQLQAGTITAEQYRAEFTKAITTAHILAAALTLGSIEAAVQDPTVKAQIAKETAYADRFVGQIGRGEAGTGPQIAARAKSYFRAIAITYGIIEQRVRGVFQTECRRIRRASESCPGCVSWSYRWMPISQMPPIGSLDCGSRCRCYLEYR